MCANRVHLCTYTMWWYFVTRAPKELSSRLSLCRSFPPSGNNQSCARIGPKRPSESSVYFYERYDHDGYSAGQSGELVFSSVRKRLFPTRNRLAAIRKYNFNAFFFFHIFVFINFGSSRCVLEVIFIFFRNRGKNGNIYTVPVVCRFRFWFSFFFL